MEFLVDLDKHVRVMEGGRESNGPQTCPKVSGWSCADPRGQADAVFICFKKIGTLTYNSIAINTYSVIPAPCKGEGAAKLHAIGKEGGWGGPGHKKGRGKNRSYGILEFLNLE